MLKLAAQGEMSEVCLLHDDAFTIHRHEAMSEPVKLRRRYLVCGVLAVQGFGLRV